MEKEVKKIITRRETLKHIIETKGLCKIYCKECLFAKNNLCRKLKVIGAMAILRMFRKKKKPILEVGSKIRFYNGKLYNIEKRVNLYNMEEYCLRDKNTKACYSMDYLIGKIWEVVEE